MGTLGTLGTVSALLGTLGTVGLWVHFLGEFKDFLEDFVGLFMGLWDFLRTLGTF